MERLYENNVLRKVFGPMRNEATGYWKKLRSEFYSALNYQLTYTTFKNVELLKHSKISKTPPTCFGLQGNHHQGATVST